MGSRLPPSPPGHPLLKNAVQFARGPFEFVEYATKECGDIYRMEFPGIKPVCVLAHPDYFDQVLVDDVDAFGKTDDFRRAFGSGLLSVEGEAWRRQRDLLQPLFYRHRIRGYTNQMVAATQRRLETWSERETRDMETEMRDLTLEILFATLFGREIVPGEDQELREAADGLNDWFAPSSWILPPWFPTPARRRFNQSTKRLRREVRDLIDDDPEATYPQGTGNQARDSHSSHQAESQEASRDLDDLLTRLQRASDTEGGRKITTDEIEDQLVTMVFAGHETTAAALAFTWYLLGTHPTIRDRFHKELESVLGGDPPSHEDLSDLSFTDQILTEAIRLYPPVHTIPRKTKTDVEVDGFRIPEGHEIHLSIIHVHRDPQFYDRPLSFRPDRWTDDFGENLHDFAYAPFGGGRRTCIGRDFAFLEAKIVLAMIGQQFELEWAGGRKPTLDPRVTTRTKEGIRMDIYSR